MNVGTLRKTNAQNLRVTIWWSITLGIWLIISPVVLSYRALPAAMWNNIAVGVVVWLTALARGTGRLYKQTGCGWLNLLSGVWLIVAPFVLDFSNQIRPLLNSVILGVLVGLTAFTALSK
jgi:uncharacterized membrane protein HdeD (DUF308 family)